MTKDIYVVGYPRSGNTWLAQMLADILNSPFTGKFYAVPIGQEGMDRPGDYTIRQLHLKPVYDDSKYNEAVPTAWVYVPALHADERIVHIYRDPRDMAVSIKHYWGLSSVQATLDIVAGEGIGPTGGTPWPEYVKLWFECEGVIHTSYEALHTNAVAELRRILDELDAVPVNDIVEAIGRQHFAQKRQQIATEPESARTYNRGIQISHLRKGIVGDWRNEFSPADRELAHRYFWSWLQKLGYETDEGWWR
jgi:hypothetical protein